MTAIINYLVAISILCIGAYTDLRYRKAKNILWLIMGGIGVILLLFPPYNLLYIAMMIAIIFLLLAIFYCLPVGGADIKAMMAVSILFPYPLGNSLLPPLYSIMMYSYMITLASIPIVKCFNRKKSFKELLTKYPFPFLVSLLGGVIVLFFIGDLTGLFL